MSVTVSRGKGGEHLERVVMAFVRLIDRLVGLCLGLFFWSWFWGFVVARGFLSWTGINIWSSEGFGVLREEFFGPQGLPWTYGLFGLIQVVLGFVGLVGVVKENWGGRVLAGILASGATLGLLFGRKRAPKPEALTNAILEAIVGGKVSLDAALPEGAKAPEEQERGSWFSFPKFFGRSRPATGAGGPKVLDRLEPKISDAGLPGGMTIILEKIQRIEALLIASGPESEAEVSSVTVPVAFEPSGPSIGAGQVLQQTHLVVPAALEVPVFGAPQASPQPPLREERDYGVDEREYDEGLAGLAARSGLLDDLDDGVKGPGPGGFAAIGPARLFLENSMQFDEERELVDHVLGVQIRERLNFWSSNVDAFLSRVREMALWRKKMGGVGTLVDLTRAVVHGDFSGLPGYDGTLTLGERDRVRIFQFLQDCEAWQGRILEQWQGAKEFSHWSVVFAVMADLRPGTPMLWPGYGWMLEDRILEEARTLLGPEFLPNDDAAVGAGGKGRGLSRVAKATSPRASKLPKLKKVARLDSVSNYLSAWSDFFSDDKFSGRLGVPVGRASVYVAGWRFTERWGDPGAEWLVKVFSIGGTWEVDAAAGLLTPVGGGDPLPWGVRLAEELLRSGLMPEGSRFCAVYIGGEIVGLPSDLGRFLGAIATAEIGHFRPVSGLPLLEAVTGEPRS